MWRCCRTTASGHPQPRPSHLPLSALRGGTLGAVEPWVDRWRRWAAALEVTPLEVVGLALLLGGGLAVTALVWWNAPTAVPVPPAAVVVEESSTATVHVAGAVQHPGVVELPAGARVADAVAAAGGATVDADLDGVNLARPVTDGERILVPRRGEVTASGGTAPGAGSAWRADGRLDLNLATAADLEELPGIGPVLAARIVDWRERHGPFTEVGQLREIPGIGERTFQNLADLVAV